MKKMIVIANVFPKLQPVNKLIRTLSKEQYLRKGFGSQPVKASKYLQNLPESAFITFFNHS